MTAFIDTDLNYIKENIAQLKKSGFLGTHGLNYGQINHPIPL